MRATRLLPAVLAGGLVLLLLACASVSSAPARDAAPAVSAPPPAEPGADPLAPLRAHLDRQIQQQIEAQQAAPDGAEGAGETQRVAPKTAPSESGKLARAATHRELQRQIEARALGDLEAARLLGSVPSLASIAELPGEFITHREITRADFRATTPEQIEFAVEVDDGSPPGAYVSLQILAVARIQLEKLAYESYEASLAELDYVAVLDRATSWWNASANHVSEEWTLRHEQLHFDLAELEARRRDASRSQVLQRLRARGRSAGEAVAALQQLWGEHLREVHLALLEREQRYDRETLHGRDLARQTEWFARGKRELRETRRAAEARSRP